MNRIAIIDDSEINLALLNALVVRLGDCEPRLFLESVEGLAWCSQHIPDLVIVDFMMPKMDGLEFIRRLRAVPGLEELPVLMITANDDKGVRYEALQIGATDFLTKPVDHIEFSARVRNMLALGASRRKLADKASWLAEEVRKATAVIHSREQELLFRMSRAAEFSRSRDRRAYPAHGTLRASDRGVSWLVDRGSGVDPAGGADARHRQDRHPRWHSAQTREVDARGVKHHENARAARIRST